MELRGWVDVEGATQAAGERRYWNLFTFPENKHKITIAKYKFSSSCSDSGAFYRPFLGQSCFRLCARFALNLDLNAFLLFIYDVKPVLMALMGRGLLFV